MSNMRELTIDEAIEHVEERACGNDQCAKDHAQLADWLRELRRARMEIDLLKTLRDRFKADAQKYKAECAKLREYAHSLELENIRLSSDNCDLLCEFETMSSVNAKLQEYIDLKETCWKYVGWCAECPYNGVDGEHDNCNCTAQEKIDSLARELGIEVGE